MTDHHELARLLESNGHDDAAKAIRDLLGIVEAQLRHIDALEHCVVVLGDEVASAEQSIATSEQKSALRIGELKRRIAALAAM